MTLEELEIYAQEYNRISGVVNLKNILNRAIEYNLNNPKPPITLTIQLYNSKSKTCSNIPKELIKDITLLIQDYINKMINESNI